MPNPPRDFYEIQEKQKARSLILFGFVLLFHFLAIGLIVLAFAWSFGLLLGRETIGSPSFWTRFLVFNGAVAFLVAFLHFQDARRNGPRFILKRLQALTPDALDRYHKQFINTVDEIRIAAGLPRVNTYVLPSFAINSLAVIEEGGTPAVAVTEGLLAEGTRDELQAVAAHELAHIARGDASYLTLVCSLANLFEKLREALEPESDTPHEAGAGRGGSVFPPVLFHLAVSVSALIMHLLSTLVSRERELLADAAAVELCRAPESLARTIYKAHVKNSFVGDFSLSYTPLFIVRPDSRDTSEGLLGRIFSSHPPLMKRIGLLAAMARKKPQAVIDAVWESEEARERARGVLHSFDELKARQLELFSQPGPGGSEAASGPAEEPSVWMLAATGGEKWEGPFTTAELIGRSRFSSLMRVKNVQEGVEAKAREFPQLRIAMSRLARKRHLSPGRENLCPRCRAALADAFYEGVPVKACRRCRGRLVDMASIDKIIVRREVAFSEALLQKARDFEARTLRNPLKKLKIEPSLSSGIACPSCGYRMAARPFNYQYFIPVDKCLSCSKIWFDSDELEILQILIESRRK